MWEGVAVAGTNMNKFWLAVATPLAWTYAWLCDFMKEFFCATAAQTLDQWMLDYGLPDDCDGDGLSLCNKVGMRGGQDCATFVQIARDAGWVIDCENMQPMYNPYAGALQAGCTGLGPAATHTQTPDGKTVWDYGACFYWRVTVYLGASLVLQGKPPAPANVPPQNDAGSFLVGATQLCGPNLSASTVLCLLDKVKPAHTILVTHVAP